MTGALRRATVRFGTTTALADASIEARPGDVWAVVGGDGAGKTTLLRALAGRVRLAAGRAEAPERRRIGFQPASSGVWPLLTVRENLEFAGRAYGMGGADIRERGRRLLRRAGLAGAADRTGAQLSGGMRQKLGFLLAILHRPELLLLDEPSTGVDPLSRVELWRLIAGAAAGGAAVVLATTYLDEAERAGRVLALDRGEVLDAGTPRELCARTPGRVIRVADPMPGSWPRGTSRHAWIAGGGALPAGAAPVEPDLEDALVARAVARHGPGVLAPEGAPEDRSAVEARGHDSPAPLAQARGLTKRFGGVAAVDRVDVRVAEGQIVGLIGPNGAGKTTLLRMLLGLARPDAGAALLFGRPPGVAARRRLGYVSQGLGIAPTLTVAQNAQFAARVYGVAPPDLPGALAAVANLPAGRIGLGLQRQLAFALALAHRPGLLVLDEPTSGVGPAERARLWDQIRAQAARGVGVLVTTHYLQEAEQCSSLVLLERGRVVARGTLAELLRGHRAAAVEAAEGWQRAMAALERAGFAVSLAGRLVRVAEQPADRVREALAAASVRADVTEVAPTLDEVVAGLATPAGSRR